MIDHAVWCVSVYMYMYNFSQCQTKFRKLNVYSIFKHMLQKSILITTYTLTALYQNKNVYSIFKPMLQKSMLITIYSLTSLFKKGTSKHMIYVMENGDTIAEFLWGINRFKVAISIFFSWRVEFSLSFYI